jgi:hypothetical protein
MIKSFRGKLADGEKQIITLHTNNGTTGYRIVKFQLMAENLGSQEYQNVVKIYSVEQTDPPTSTVDFSDQTLLAAGYYEGNMATGYNEDLQVIFDNIVFNQDVYITHKDDDGLQPVNYYIEMEIVALSLDQSTTATLRNLRNNE